MCTILLIDVEKSNLHRTIDIIIKIANIVGPAAIKVTTMI